MALTLPFINTIPAFDATKGTSLNINVLGGDSITGYQYFLFLNDGSDTPFYSSEIFSVVGDIASENIRTFPISVPANASGNNITLINNNTYRVQAYIFNENESIYGNYAVFQCYVEPSVTLQYQSFVGQTVEYVDLEEGSIIPSSNPNLQCIFNPQDINSEAQPNSLILNLYGIQNGQKVLINSTGNLYNFTYSLIEGEINYTSQFRLSGFSINLDKISSTEYTPKADALYSSFIVEYECTTIEGMIISGEIKNIDCFYNIILHSPYLSLQNLCQKGVIQITCQGLTSLMGTSNPPLDQLVFIDDSELDLTQSSSWVQWQKYFSLQQPYSVGIWCRDMQDGAILNMTATFSGSAYITLTKESEDFYDENTNTYINYTFVSLKSGVGNLPPYYIESEKFLTSTIDENTKFYINIQSQDGLFNLSLQKLN